MDGTKNRYLTWIYTGIWVLVAGFYLLDVMRARSYTSQPLLDLGTIAHMFRALLPFWCSSLSTIGC